VIIWKWRINIGWKNSGFVYFIGREEIKTLYERMQGSEEVVRRNGLEKEEIMKNLWEENLDRIKDKILKKLYKKRERRRKG